jgi:hypothetical protein
MASKKSGGLLMPNRDNLHQFWPSPLPGLVKPWKILVYTAST